MFLVIGMKLRKMLDARPLRLRLRLRRLRLDSAHYIIQLQCHISRQEEEMKCVVVGTSDVGKTCLVMVLQDNVFPSM
jgi:GTPase SAR1 family protein